MNRTRLAIMGLLLFASVAVAQTNFSVQVNVAAHLRLARLRANRNGAADC